MVGGRLGLDPAVAGNWLGESLHPHWEESTTGGGHVGGDLRFEWLGGLEREAP
jgi:hypothetical protein